MITTHFEGTPSVGDLFRALWELIKEWVSTRIQAYRYKKLDFRPLREDEITDEIRAEVERARNAPNEDFVNL